MGLINQSSIQFLDGVLYWRKSVMLMKWCVHSYSSVGWALKSLLFYGAEEYEINCMPLFQRTALSCNGTIDNGWDPHITMGI